MGHIGTYGDPVYISELENDIGLTPDSGTVTDVEIQAGKFEGVQNPTTVPFFKIPTDTSHLSNSISEGGAGWQNGTIRTVKRNGDTVATYTPPNSGSANILVNTKLSQFTNDAGYTNNAGTITGLSLSGGVPTEGKTITSGSANLNASGNINEYFNNSGYATRDYASKFTNTVYAYSIDGFTYNDTDIPTPSIYLLRYGKLRLLYFSIAFSASNTKIKTNSEYILGTFGTGQDKPSSRYNGLRFSIGDGKTVYLSSNNTNHYYPVSVLLGSTSSLMLEIGGEGTSKEPHPYNPCTTTNFRAVWIVD